MKAEVIELFPVSPSGLADEMEASQMIKTMLSLSVEEGDLVRRVLLSLRHPTKRKALFELIDALLPPSAGR